MLRQAAVHRSFLNENPGAGQPSYERLEYLGDAFLGWVVADELYAQHPTFSEGDLTRARASLVRGRALAEVGRSIDIGRYLILGQGEEATGGRERQSTLAAAVEAVLGAVLLDRGPKAARALVLRWLGERLDQIDAAGTPRDAKSALQELTQGKGFSLPQYEVVSQEGPAHAKHFEVRVLVDGVERGRGSGGRRSDAEQAAAAQAFDAMQRNES